MAVLQTILNKVSIKSIEGSTNVEIKDLQIDSRMVTKGTCFIAVKGTSDDGHVHIGDAISKGAIAIVYEESPNVTEEHVTYIQVENSMIATGLMASKLYGDPSSKLKVTGVTGTNGKTTVATILFRLFTSLGYKCGLLSTVQNQIGDQIIAATHTTPNAIELNKLLAQMVNSNCTHVFMEVSSHAIHQHRVTSISFAGGIFTNITHDHLDYHKTFDEYIRVKKSFFDTLPPTSFALSNADDKRGKVMLQNTVAKKYYYSLQTVADYKGKVMENRLSGLQMVVNNIEVHFKLIGTFNAYNLLAIYGAAVLLGEEKMNVLAHLSKLQSAEGRFDYITSPKSELVGIVDYAHTPDALLNVLTTIKSLRQGNEQIITVVGCGGDRDKTKRPIMAEVCCKHSDRIIFTSDNPRSEDPAIIIKEMEAGVKITCRKKCLSIVDRYEAIKTAVNIASKNDIILIAGKGHEKYQEIKGIKNVFDDKKVLNEVFLMLDK